MVLVGRLLQMAAMIAALSLGLFYLLHLMPGSPEEALLASNPDLRAEDLERIRSLRGLDRPILERYVCWLVGRGHASFDPELRRKGDLPPESTLPSGGAGAASSVPARGQGCGWWPSESGILGGDLGYSHLHKLPVSRMLALRIPNTLALMLPAFLIALLASVPLGVTAALGRGRWPDRLVSGLSFLAISLPMHWLAMLAILGLSLGLGLFPSSGIEDVGAPSTGSVLHHLVLPVSVLSFFYIGRWTRYVRASMQEIIHLDWIRTARAKGLGERAVVWRHAVPNALLPLMTIVSQSIPALFAGSLVIERIFAYPGVGVLIYESIEGSDYLVAIVVFVIYAAMAMATTLIADTLHALLDPRIRAGAPLEGPA